MATPTNTPTALSADYDFEKTGYGICIEFENLAGDDTERVYPFFACKAVKDAGFAAGDPIDITTNLTVGAREQAPADLASPSEITLTAAYNLDDRVLAQGILGIPCVVKIQYRGCGNRSNPRQVVYKGAFLSGYEPQEMREGEQPEVSITIGFPGGSHYAGDTSFNPAGTLEAYTTTAG